MLLSTCIAVIAVIAQVAATDKCKPPADKPCPGRCHQTCANPNPLNCDPNAKCSCQDGYVFCCKNGECIPIYECPTDLGCNGDKNAVIRERPYGCPSTCKEPGPRPCNKLDLTVGCACKSGYILSKSGGKCILPNKCPCGNPCRGNETLVDCAVGCPSDYCPVDDSNVIILCAPVYPCPSGCACKYGYKRKSTDDKRCILAEDCPPVNCTRCNEEWNPCPPPCFSESCADVDKPPTVCETFAKPVCNPQCVCKSHYRRNDNNECIPEEQCSKPCPDRCLQTCDNPNPKNCDPNPNCKCQDGSVFSSKNGKCIPIYECPSDFGCNGDKNAVIRDRPYGCPSTCDAPGPRPCSIAALTVGCVCKSGYILSKPGGKCILADKCTGGSPCGVNSTFVDCAVGCPSENCPADDSNAIIACSIAYPCPSGCACKYGYKRKSSADKQCILAQDCPPVKCTRYNEEWNPCPQPCFSESCADVDKPPTVCETFAIPVCNPQCVCKPDYRRNDNNECIREEQCPANLCPDRCQQTCDNPNPQNCDPNPNCKCQDGSVFSSQNGKCIPIYECPTDLGCNGDKNAVIRDRPYGCPSTCDAPGPRPCNIAALTVGCVCKSGYILSKPDGECILSDKCPGGHPCGVNGTLIDCAFGCPSDYCPVDDSNAMVACAMPMYPCPSGCACKYRYRKKSTEDKRCILAEDCPPVKCTRGNEEWNPCPPPCFSESCTDVNKKPTVCETFAIPSCYPQCTCKPHYRRNDNNDCIPEEQCPGYIST